MGQLKSGEATGGCSTYAEILKTEGTTILLWLHTLLCLIWNTEIIPTDWRQGVVVPIWKGKGDIQECNNYRGLPSSLCEAGSWHEFFSTVRQELLTHQRH